jgi:hypothetical protein
MAESIDFIQKANAEGRQSVVTNNLSSSNGDYALKSNIYGDNYTTHNNLPLLEEQIEEKIGQYGPDGTVIYAKEDYLIEQTPTS